MVLRVSKDQAKLPLEKAGNRKHVQGRLALPSRNYTRILSSELKTTGISKGRRRFSLHRYFLAAFCRRPHIYNLNEYKFTARRRKRRPTYDPVTGKTYHPVVSAIQPGRPRLRLASSPTRSTTVARTLIALKARIGSGRSR